MKQSRRNVAPRLFEYSEKIVPFDGVFIPRQAIHLAAIHFLSLTPERIDYLIERDLVPKLNPAARRKFDQKADRSTLFWCPHQIAELAAVRRGSRAVRTYLIPREENQ